MHQISLVRLLFLKIYRLVLKLNINYKYSTQLVGKHIKHCQNQPSWNIHYGVLLKFMLKSIRTALLKSSETERRKSNKNQSFSCWTSWGELDCCSLICWLHFVFIIDVSGNQSQAGNDQLSLIHNFSTTSTSSSSSTLSSSLRQTKTSHKRPF